MTKWFSLILFFSQNYGPFTQLGALAWGALLKLPSLGNPEDLPQVNGGFTRPKGPSHPAVGQGVNCPPLGPPGHCSSPGGTTDL